MQSLAPKAVHFLLCIIFNVHSYLFIFLHFQDPPVTCFTDDGGLCQRLLVNRPNSQLPLSFQTVNHFLLSLSFLTANSFLTKNQPLSLLEMPNFYLENITNFNASEYLASPITVTLSVDCSSFWQRNHLIYCLCIQKDVISEKYFGCKFTHLYEQPLLYLHPWQPWTAM